VTIRRDVWHSAYLVGPCVSGYSMKLEETKNPKIKKLRRLALESWPMGRTQPRLRSLVPPPLASRPSEPLQNLRCDVSNLARMKSRLTNVCIGTALLLAGDYYTGSVLATTLTKLVLRFAENSTDLKKTNGLRAEVCPTATPRSGCALTNFLLDSRPCLS
jgi:hypothetical protein